MKIFVALILIIYTCSDKENPKEYEYSINIWDYNYSMAFITHYKINADSIIVTAISGIENESNKILLSRIVSEKEKKCL